LLPILKEVIKILFQEGLIKVLFATGTFFFFIGLNMLPALGPQQDCSASVNTSTQSANCFSLKPLWIILKEQTNVINSKNCFLR
ncbi:hypothetical protein BY996DRAFT_4575017, partial [Phakopsora pachyrhizi]